MRSSGDVARGGRIRIQGWIPELTFLAVTTAAGVAARGRWFNPIGDNGLWWSLLSRLSSGDHLYRDVYLQYGPLSPYALMVGARVFGLSPTYLVVTGWIAAMACALLLLRLAKRLLSEPQRLAVAAVMLPLSVFGPGVSPLVLSYAPAAVHALALSLAAILLVVGSEEREGRALWAGMASGLAFCAKPEIGLVALVSLCGYLGIVRALRSAGLRALAGFAAPAALGFAFVLWSQPDPALWRRSHLWPLVLGVPDSWKALFRILMGLSGPDWGILVRGSVWTLLALVAGIAVAGLLVARERSRRAWVPVGALIAVVAIWWLVEGYLLEGRFWPACLSALVSAAVVLWSLADRRLPPRSRALLFAVSIFAALNGARSLFSTDLFGPYAKVAQFTASLTWVIFACRCVPAILAPSERAARATRALATAAVLAASVLAAGRSFAHLNPPAVVAFRTSAGTVYPDGGMARFLALVRSGVRAGETAAIFPEVNAVDVLFGLRDLSPWLTHSPGWLDDDAESELIRRFEAEPPDVVVLFRRPTWLFRMAPFGQGYGRKLASWIAERYSPVAERPEGIILRPRNRPV